MFRLRVAIKRIIPISSGKGGVGKTTFAINFALALSRHGRTILVDWSICGAGPPLTELGHYLALNCARLPIGHTKDDTITAYRAALERHGIVTQPWWDRQLALCLVGTMLLLGWEKSFDESGAELAWWRERTLEGVRSLQ